MDNSHYYISRITRHLFDNPHGMTISEIADELSFSRNTVGKYIEMMHISGTVESRSIGKAKLYHLSSRIPNTKLLSMLPISVIQTDNNYKISDVNIVAEDFLTDCEKNLIGRNIVDLLTMQGLKNDIRMRILSSERKEAFSQEIDINLKERTHTCWLTVADITLNNGKPGHIFFIEDVNDWKEAENQKRRYELLFSFLAGEFDDPIFIISPDLVFTYANQSYAKSIGKDPQDLIGNNRSQYYDGRSGSIIKEAAGYVVAKGEPYRTILRIQDGNNLRWFDERLFPISGNNRDVYEILGISREITGFQEGGSAKVLLSNILDLVREAIITTTPAGRILSWNIGAELMTGYPADALVGSMALTIITPELNDGRDLVKETMSGGEIKELKAIIRARGGRKKRVYLSTSRLSVQGGIVSGVCIVIREHQ